MSVPEYLISSAPQKDLSDMIDCIGTIMSLCVGSGRMGMAWYDPDNNEVRCMEGLDEGQAVSQPLSLVHHTISHVQPRTIYISSKMPSYMSDALKDFQQKRSSKNDELLASHSSFEIRLERAKLFSMPTALNLLSRVYVPCINPQIVGRDRLHAINTLMNLSAEQQTCATGALLSILIREQQVVPQINNGSEHGIHLSFLGEMSLSGYLMVDPISLEALGIFNEDTHPSSMGIGRAKEGLSVFGVMNRCVSPPGRRMLRLWFARPLLNTDLIKERQEAIEHLIKGGKETMKRFMVELRLMKDPSATLSRIQGTQTLPVIHDFLQLKNSLAALLRLKALLRSFSLQLKLKTSSSMGLNSQNSTANSMAQLQASWETSDAAEEFLARGSHHGADEARCESGSILAKLLDGIDDSLITTHQLIAGVIDQDQISEGMCIAYGVSKDLDDMKRLYYGLPDLLQQATLTEIYQLPAPLQKEAAEKWSCIYTSTTGFVLHVEGGLLPADILEYLDNAILVYEGIMSTDGKVGSCYETSLTRQLTERYGNIKSQINDLETAILGRIVQSISENYIQLRKATSASAELDCLIALAMAAIDFNLQKPIINNFKLTRKISEHQYGEDSICIKNGRHILAEMVLTPGTFIPNDTNIGKQYPRVHCITGPNASGKSCYSKQIAIIVFLAHIGSYVPAESAEISLTDRIMTRMVTHESATIPQSAFMIDLSQVASMIHLATSRTLLLIDEFGKGTLPSDGAALVCSVLKHFSSAPVQSNSPKVILSTHFSEVGDQKYLENNNAIAFSSMAVSLNDEPSDTSENLEEKKIDHTKTDSNSNHIQPKLPLISLKTNQIPDKVTFLYRLSPGLSMPSFGLYCAMQSGIAEPILLRAQDVLRNIIQREKPISPLSIHATNKRHKLAFETLKRVAEADFNSSGKDSAFEKALSIFQDVKQVVCESKITTS